MKTQNSVLGMMLVATMWAAGCAAPVEQEVEESNADLTASSAGTVDPTVTSPVAWACNISNGQSLVFVQEAVHRARGTLSFYPDAQDPDASFAELSAGGGQTALGSSKVRFRQEGQQVSFTLLTIEPGFEHMATPLTVDMSQQVTLGERTYPWTGALVETPEDLIVGCWGVR